MGVTSHLARLQLELPDRVSKTKGAGSVGELPSPRCRARLGSVLSSALSSVLICMNCV